MVRERYIACLRALFGMYDLDGIAGGSNLKFDVEAGSGGAMSEWSEMTDTTDAQLYLLACLCCG